MGAKRRVEMDGMERRMGEPEGASQLNGAEEAVERALEKSVDPDAAMEGIAESGEEPMHDSTIDGGKEPAAVALAAGEKEPIKVGTTVGVEEPAQDEGGAAAGEVGPVQAADGGSEAEWRRRAEGYALRAVFSEARAAAAAMGVPENRLDHVARLSDLSGIGPEEEGARERIAQAVRAVLRELPELHGGVGTGQATTARKPRRDAFERGFLGE
jgi:hypothetical protein